MERQRLFFLARATMTLLLAMLTTVGTWATITGSGTLTDPYVLNDAADWATFANQNNANTYWGSNVYVKLSDTWDNSSNAVTAMVGTNSNKFCGTFNGNGKTLTLALTTDVNEFTAPFRYIDGATIKLLHTAGTVNGGNQKYATGLIGMSYGTVTITSCHSSVAITSDRSNLGNDQRDATHGGFIGVAEGTVTFTNCLFDGSITDAAATNCGGFVGWRNGTLTFNNCLMAGTMTLSSTNGTATFSRNNGEKTTLNHCYYKTSYGDVQGTAVGETNNATLIDNEHLGSGWEISGNNVIPMMNKYNMAFVTISGLNSKYLYNNDNAIAISYTVTDLGDTQLTAGTHFNAIITKGGETVNSVTDKGEYVLTLTGLSPYTGTKTLNFTVADADLTISSAEDWNTFANNVSNGETYSGKYVKLASNFDNSSTPVTRMVGSNEHRFYGTFDGNGKTLTISLSAQTNDCAPFLYLDGATITDLTVAGSVSTPAKFGASIAAHTYGTTNITNCTSTVTITSTATSSDDGTHGGFVAVNEGNATLYFTNCVFKGEMLGGNASSNGGFVGWNSGTKINYTDCLFAPTQLTMSTESSNTFNRNGNNELTRCYYTEAFGEKQGTRVYTTAQSNFCNKLALHGSDYYYIGNAVITTPMYYDYNGGSAITVTYAMTYEGAELNADCYTATFTKGGNPVTTVTDKGSYILTLTGNNSKGYYGSKSVSFNVLGNEDAVLSEDKTFDVNAEGRYYVNMRTVGPSTLTLPDATITTFKVYDDGGWQDFYSNNCNSTLTITAPEGYAIMLSGEVRVATDNQQWNAPSMNRASRRAVPTSDEELGNDYLTVYDGTTTSAPRLGKEKYGNESIRSLYSTGRSMTLHFQSDENNSREGLNLTVKLVSTTTEYDIVIPEELLNGQFGGTITASVGGKPATKAKLNDKVTLTITPADGYRFAHLYVSDQTSQCQVTVADDNTFLMPAGNLLIKAMFIPAVPTTYIDENGVSKTVMATRIESQNGEYHIDFPGFYTVRGKHTTSNTIYIQAHDDENVCLILEDDATLTCPCISAYQCSLSIYGQSKGNGTLNISHEGGAAISTAGYKQYGGIVKLDCTNSNAAALEAYNYKNILIAGGSLTIAAEGQYARAIWAKNLTISGGQVTATATYENNNTTALDIENNVVLGCSSSKDFIQINGDINLYNTKGTVSITSGQTLTDGTNTYTGVLSDEQISNLKGQTLTPVVANITLANDDSNADAEEKNAAIITDKKGALANVTLADRTLTKDGNWNTLCLPFSMTAAQIASSDLADATIKELDNSDNGTKLDAGKLTLKFNTVTAIEAGKPYIVKWATTGSNISNPVFNDVIISSTAASEVESDDKNVKFVGQYSPFSIGDTSNGTYDGDINEILYVGSANKIGYSAKARTLKSCRAHFWVKPKETNAPAVNSINIDWGDGETTSLSEELKVNSEKFATATAWYTLDGRKLNAKPNAKGVYINNGRKTVIK